MSRVARSAGNYLTAALTQAVTLVLSLWATWWILHWLGDERAGAFRATSDWLGYLTLLELGFAGALMPLIAQAIHRNEPQRLAALMAEGFRTYRRVAGAMLVGGLVLAAIIPWLVPVSAGLVRDLRIAALLGAAAALLAQFAPLRPLWEADQRGYVINIVLAVQSVAIIGISLLLARGGWGITGQQIAVVIGLSLFSTVLLWQTARGHPQVLSWIFAPADREARHAIWKLNWPTVVMNVSGRASLLADNIVIAYFLAPAAVVPFWYTQALIRIAATQLQSVGNATWAGLAQLHHTGQRELFDQRVQELTRLTVILAVTVLVPIAAYNGVFVRLWLGADRFGGNALTILAAVNALLLALSSLWGWLFSGTGLMARLAPLGAATGVLNVTISVGLTALLKRTAPELALLGPVIGTTVALGSVNLFGLPVLMARTFELKVSPLARATLVPLLAAVPYALAVVLVARAATPHGWIGLSAQMGAAAAVYLAAAFFVVLPARERELWRLRLRLGIAALRGRRTEGENSEAEANPKAPATNMTSSL